MLCWGNYFESKALQAASYLTLQEAELQQSLVNQSYLEKVVQTTL